MDKRQDDTRHTEDVGDPAPLEDSRPSGAVWLLLALLVMGFAVPIIIGLW